MVLPLIPSLCVMYSSEMGHLMSFELCIGNIPKDGDLSMSKECWGKKLERRQLFEIAARFVTLGRKKVEVRFKRVLRLQSCDFSSLVQTSFQALIFLSLREKSATSPLPNRHITSILLTSIIEVKHQRIRSPKRFLLAREESSEFIATQ
ncbi:hypothetical protein ACOSP7_003226 [Xanthoceras sorbifolium]